MRTLRPLLLVAAALSAACPRNDSGVPASAPPPRAAAPAETAAPVLATAEGPEWSLTLEAPAACRAGEKTLARVAFQAKGGWHVNPDYPTGFEPAADGTVRVDGARVAISPEWKPCGTKAEDKCSGSGSFPFTAPSPGPSRLSGTVAFSVCNPEKCLIEKARVTVAIQAR
jgi:hypothetical protein